MTEPIRIRRKEMERANQVQQIARGILEHGLGGDAVIMVTVHDAHAVPAGDGHMLSGNLYIGMSVGTDPAKYYCELIRDAIMTAIGQGADSAIGAAEWTNGSPKRES